MLTGERELYQRFVAYDDEELLRILTVERAKYRSEALAAAELVLTQRSLAAPPPFRAPEPPRVHVKGCAQNPYEPLDLFVDAVLFGSLYWVTGKLGSGTLFPDVWLLDAVMRLLLSASVTVVMIYLRHGWRTKEWWD